MSMTPIEMVKFLERKSMSCLTLIEHMRWMAQSVHQAYHQDQEGTWAQCDRAFCKGTLGVIESALES